MLTKTQTQPSGHRIPSAVVAKGPSKSSALPLSWWPLQLEPSIAGPILGGPLVPKSSLLLTTSVVSQSEGQGGGTERSHLLPQSH